jgi:hypothetical protein
MSILSIVTLVLIWCFAALVIAALWHTIISEDDDNYPNP